LQPIRVLIVDMPRMLHEIVHRSVDECDDMLVVGSLHDRDEGALVQHVEETGPEVVVIGADHPDVAAQSFPSLLANRAMTKLLAVADDGGETFLYELRPARTPLGELSPTALLAAIRSAAAPT
jgi:DNA-binding NarL/FixJ family response regulator